MRDKKRGMNDLIYRRVSKFTAFHCENLTYIIRLPKINCPNPNNFGINNTEFRAYAANISNERERERENNCNKIESQRITGIQMTNP